MDRIFIDLEFAGISRANKEARKICRFETIQIGAVRVNEENIITSKFSQLVKPQFAHISREVSNLTHISEEDIAGAPGYVEAMNRFVEWVGEEPVKVYSWSMEDKKQIQSENGLNGYRNDIISAAFNEWVDFQKLFGEMIGVKQQVSLTNALNVVGITFEGQAHTAADDAENTARLYILAQDKVAFEKHAKAIIEIMTPTPTVTTSMGSLLTPELLGKLKL